MRYSLSTIRCSNRESFLSAIFFYTKSVTSSGLFYLCDSEFICFLRFYVSYISRNGWFKISSMKIKQIAELLQSEFVGDGEIKISRVASLETAKANEISFIEKAETFTSSNAACLLVPENFDAELPCSFIKVKNPKLALAKIAEILYKSPSKSGIESTANIHETTKIGEGVFVGAFVSIGENSKIGDIRATI